MAQLGEAVRTEGADLYEVPDEQVPEPAVAMDRAADVEFSDPAYRSELT
jgi:hypothetical protein